MENTGSFRVVVTPPQLVPLRHPSRQRLPFAGPQTASVPALILGRGVAALGALRLLSSAGVDCHMFGGPHGMEHRSRWFKLAPGANSSLDRPDRLADYLRTEPFERAVLIPCSDAWVKAVAALPAELSDRFPASAASAQAIRTLTDKAAFARLVARLCIPAPDSYELSRGADLARVADDTLKACFLKPCDSQSFAALFGVKALRIGSRAEAAAHLDRVESRGQQVLLQEWIPGPGSNHYLIDGFVDQGGLVKGLFARRRLRIWPEQFGNSSYMASIDPQEVAPAIEALRRILAYLDYRGIFSAEFKRDERDGQFKILEINSRAWWFVEFAGRCGVDVCSMAYRDALGMYVDPVHEYRVGERLVYPYADFFACKLERSRGRLGFWAWLRSWVGAQQAHFRWTDPLPALVELSHHVKLRAFQYALMKKNPWQKTPSASYPRPSTVSGTNS